VPKQTAKATMEATRKRGRPRKRCRDEVEEDFNIVGKQKGSGQRPPGMEEDCIGRQGPHRTVALENNNKKNKC
jgi:hypothetical protein